MGENTISILVPAKQSIWRILLRAVISITIASLMVMLLYGVLLSRVFPGLVTANLLPATLTFDQASMLSIGIWAFSKSISWIEKI